VTIVLNKSVLHFGIVIAIHQRKMNGTCGEILPCVAQIESRFVNTVLRYLVRNSHNGSSRNARKQSATDGSTVIIFRSEVAGNCDDSFCQNDYFCSKLQNLTIENNLQRKVE
jgi:hypothetical protein